MKGDDVGTAGNVFFLVKFLARPPLQERAASESERIGVVVVVVVVAVNDMIAVIMVTYHVNQLECDRDTSDLPVSRKETLYGRRINVSNFFYLRT